MPREVAKFEFEYIERSLPEKKLVYLVSWIKIEYKIQTLAYVAK